MCQIDKIVVVDICCVNRFTVPISSINWHIIPSSWSVYALIIIELNILMRLVLLLGLATFYDVFLDNVLKKSNIDYIRLF